MTNPLDSLNITNVAEITREQFIEVANKTMAMPHLVILYLWMIFLFLFIGYFSVKDKRSKGKILGIWFMTAVGGLILLLALIFLPNFFQNIIDVVRGWF